MLRDIVFVVTLLLAVNLKLGGRPKFDLCSVALRAPTTLATLKASDNAYVQPVDWKRFRNSMPSDTLSVIEREILQHANRFSLTTWYREVKKFTVQAGDILQFGGVDEHHVRAPASVAFSLAVAYRTGIYDERGTGMPEAEAKHILNKLIASVAKHHKANTPNGWGDHWQSAHWAAYAGAAGWFIWSELNDSVRDHVRHMVEYEANRFLNYEVPYYKDNEGKEVYRGDSKSEENSWNAMVLQVATAMMPKHVNHRRWSNKNIELLLSAHTRPSDLNSTRTINGYRLKDFLNGSNIEENGTVINHGFIHPDYMTCTSHAHFCALMYSLAGLPTPEAAFFNTDLIYSALVDLPFASPPYATPGGTIYIPESADIYYPKHTDWGHSRRMCFALMDCQAAAFNIDRNASVGGDKWERLHAGAVLMMQQRSADGRTYLSAEEDTYLGREEWVAVLAAQAWLTKWIIHHEVFSRTNKGYN